MLKLTHLNGSGFNMNTESKLRMYISTKAFIFNFISEHWIRMRLTRDMLCLCIKGIPILRMETSHVQFLSSSAHNFPDSASQSVPISMGSASCAEDELGL